MPGRSAGPWHRLAVALAASAGTAHMRRGARHLAKRGPRVCAGAAGEDAASAAPCRPLAFGRRATAASAFARCLLAAALAPAAALAADGADLMRKGMEAFQQSRVADSVTLFDESASAGYPKAMLWQRGLSLYYADRFEDGATQFRKDVEMNPNDTEESIWAMLCEAQTLGFEEARKRMLVVGRDGRRVMRTVYSLFRGEDEATNLEALRKAASGGGGDQFYAALYLGLFAEARGDKAEAKRWITQATASKYAKTSGDYMADLARVHKKVRGWGEQSSEL